MRMSHILFDLDGTLTDPAEGITNSILYALKKFDIADVDRSSLLCCIGPPLLYSFRTMWDMSEADARRAVKYYREYFTDKGIYENAIYPGIPELLQSLADNGNKLYLATSKPEEYAAKILEHFDIDAHFTCVAGNTLSESRPEKIDVLNYLLERFSQLRRDNTLMVGDRCYDVQGAKACGLRCVGVLYGYGSREELVSAGADYLAESVGALDCLLTGLFGRRDQA